MIVGGRRQQRASVACRVARQVVIDAPAVRIGPQVMQSFDDARVTQRADVDGLEPDLAGQRAMRSFAARSSPTTGTVTGPPASLGSSIVSAPSVLNALTT